MAAVDLLRHGQSTFNEAYAATGVDPLHFDARLTELGRRQVAEARERLLSKSYDLVVTSPLTRAIETAVGVFGGRGIPIVVEHLHRERLESSCDVGRSAAELSAEFPTSLSIICLRLGGTTRLSATRADSQSRRTTLSKSERQSSPNGSVRAPSGRSQSSGTAPFSFA